MELTPTQKQILNFAKTLPQPLVIKGTAGSGKSFITAKLAHQFAQQPNAAVYVVTYTNDLIKDIQAKNPAVKNLQIATAHESLNRFLDINGQARLTNFDNQFKTLKNLCATQPFENYEFRFLREEFKWMLDRHLTSLEQYKTLSSPRTAEMLPDQKAYIWRLFEEHTKQLRAKKLHLFQEIANYCLDFIKEHPDYKPLCTHLVIDEFQDLAPNVIEALTQICRPANQIVYVGDLAQSVYQHGKSWKEFDMEHKKVFELRENFRNTKQIANAAQNLLDNEYKLNEHDRQDYTEMNAVGPDGIEPIVAVCRNSKEQLWYLRNELTYLPPKSKVAIIERNQDKDPNSPINQLCRQYHITHHTMHGCKGLEFDYVFIINANADRLPNPSALKQYPQTTLANERRLLFVAMTRARKQLFILTSSYPSKLLAEIAPSFILPVALDYMSYHRLYQERLKEVQDKIAQIEQDKEQYARSLREHAFLTDTVQAITRGKTYFRPDAKILILGGDGCIKANLVEYVCQKEMKLGSGIFEWLHYEDLKRFNLQSLEGNLNYCDVIVGCSPHNSGCCENYVAQLERHQNDGTYYAKIHILRGENGKLGKLTKEKLISILQESKKLEQVQEQ